MAEAMFNASPPDGWGATSGGVRTAARPNDRTAPMLREIGLELPDHRPQLVTSGSIESAAIRVTMGCLDDASCPAHLKTLELRDWGVPVPAKLDDAGFRAVCDQLRRRVDGPRSEIELEQRRASARRPATVL
jgi:arsenate reductase (thioredoxin)